MAGVRVNRAPVLAMWGAVVAERLGHARGTARSLGQAVAALNAQSKGRRLGIFGAPEEAGEAERRPAPGAARTVPLLGRQVPVRRTPRGERAVLGDELVQPAGVDRYLRQKFGEHLDEVEAAMQALARAYPPHELEAEAWPLYERFRPAVPQGTRGWGARGELDLELLHDLAAARRPAGRR